MKNFPRISDAEWQVMKVVWGRSPLAASAIVDILEPTTTWNHHTIKTLINRLVLKKVLGYRKEGRRHLFFPRVAEADCVREENRSFLQRVYGGAVRPMLAAFIEEEELSAEDIAELKRILNNKGR